MLGPEPDKALLENFFAPYTPDIVDPNTDIETNRRNELAKRIREEYVDLINEYGKSHGRALKVTPFPNPKFNYFTITSSRNCPEIAIEDPNNENVSLKVTLESKEHKDDVVAKYYDPSKLTSVFPGDALEVELWATGIASASGLNYRTKTFLIYPERVFKIDSEMGLMRMKEGGAEALNSHSEDNIPSLGELESLITLAPLLRKDYEVLKGEISQVESSQSSVKQLQSPMGRFLQLFQRGR